ncbi:MAG: hypothetical protein DWQ04_16965 [Chloroflexi bacterium]|nr:MAG: hypothetical protein DWQ04_16965 [Chloroflexota bacterium]
MIHPTATPTSAATQEPVTGGIGVIGDSNSVAYQDWERSGPYSRSWVEMSNELRGADFGQYLSYWYNRSSYWNKSRNMTGQAGALEGYIQNGEIDIVLIWIGNVDADPICDVYQDQSQIDFIQDEMTSYPPQAVNQLISTGMPANKIYYVLHHYIGYQSPYHYTTDESYRDGYQEPCVNQAQYSDFIDDINAELTGVLAPLGVNLIDAHSVFSALDNYKTAPGQYEIDGHAFSLSRCDLPNCLFVADGNFNTVLQGIAFNEWFAGPLGFAPFTDAEIAAIAGME